MVLTTTYLINNLIQCTYFVHTCFTFVLIFIFSRLLWNFESKLYLLLSCPLVPHLVSDSNIISPLTSLNSVYRTPWMHVTFPWSTFATWGEVTLRGRQFGSWKSRLNNAHQNSITHEHHPGTHLHPLVDLIKVSGIASKRTHTHTHLHTNTGGAHKSDFKAS